MTIFLNMEGICQFMDLTPNIPLTIILLVYSSIFAINLQYNSSFGIEKYLIANQFGSKGTNNGYFNEPTGVTIDHSDKSIYIADTNNNRIQKFDSNGNFIL